MSKHRGRMFVSRRLLEELLLPPGGKIVYLAEISEAFYQNAYELVISHPELPEVVEGAVPELVSVFKDSVTGRVRFYERREEAKECAGGI